MGSKLGPGVLGLHIASRQLPQYEVSFRASTFTNYLMECDHPIKRRPGVATLRCLCHPCRNKITSTAPDEFILVCERDDCRNYASSLPAETLEQYIQAYHQAIRDLEEARLQAKRATKEALVAFKQTQGELAKAFIYESAATQDMQYE
jgi:hypothetical protein